MELPKWRQVGAAGTVLPNLQQVWFKYAKLAASMAVQAILGAFLAALQSPDSSTKFRQPWQAPLTAPVFPAALQSSTNTMLVQAIFN